MLKISIVTVVKNGEEFIEETLNSVLSQDYPNIEYIVIDGNSTDTTPNIIRKYKSRLAISLREDDKGQTDALIKGLNLATGDYVCWLNYDDLFYSNQTIKELVHFINEHPNMDLYYGDDILIDEQGSKIACRKFKYFSFRRLLVDRSISQPATIFSKSAFIKWGLNADLEYSMDLDFFLKVFKHKRTKYVNFAVALNRIHQSRKMSAHYSAALKEAMDLRIAHGLNFFIAHMIYTLRIIVYNSKKN